MSAKTYLLRATLADMQRRGEIREAFNWTEQNGTVSVYIERIRAPRPRVPWYIAGVTVAMGAVVGLGVMLWHSRYIWMALAGVALLVAGIVRLLGNHSGACIGLHCPGCKG